MSTQLPPWLEQLHARHARPAAAAPSSAPHPRVEAGQIRLLVPMDPGAPPALVLVTESDHELEAHTVVLVSPDTEFGGDRDLLLGNEETGLAYDVLVQAEVASYAWTVQLDAVHGQISQHWLDAVTNLMADGPEPVDPDLRAGSTIVSRQDPRWPFKVAELGRLTELCGECSRQLIDEVEATVVDVPSLQLHADEDDEDHIETLEYLLHLTEAVASGQVIFPTWVVDRLFDADLDVAYRRAGIYEAYQALLSLVAVWLGGLPDETIPEPHAGGVPVLDRTMQQLLEQQRRHGHTSVRVYCRDTDIDPRHRVVRASAGSADVQCIRIPCHT
jgi:hypothetical protein